MTYQFGVDDASYQAAGGEAGVVSLVHDFYEIMDSNNGYRGLRSLHQPDLSLSKDKLATFLCGWLGGPRHYREKFGPISIPQAHQHIVVNEETKEQWLSCMQLAIDKQQYTAEFSEYLITQLRVPAERIVTVNKG